MTKEQYLIFKSDLKASIASIKAISKKFNKDYHNAGFNTPEEFAAANRAAMAKSLELDKSIQVRKKTWSGDKPVIDASEQTTHLAYYCAKHQLHRLEIEQYIKDEFKKMRPPYNPGDINWFYEYKQKYLIRDVWEILNAYEKVVCSD